MLPLWAVSTLSGQIRFYMAKTASPHLLPKCHNKLFESAPRHHSAVRQRQNDVREDRKPNSLLK